MLGEISPQCKCGESLDTFFLCGKFLPSLYPSNSVLTKLLSRVIAAFSPNNKTFYFKFMLILLFAGIILSAVATKLFLFIFGVLTFGVSTAIYSAMQSTIIYQEAPKELRSSIFSLLTLAIGIGAIGSANIQLMSKNISTSQLTVIMGSEGLLFITLFVSIMFFSLRKKP